MLNPFDSRERETYEEDFEDPRGTFKKTKDTYKDQLKQENDDSLSPYNSFDFEGAIEANESTMDKMILKFNAQHYKSHLKDY